MISEKIRKKVERRQAHITTNEDLSVFSYSKHGKNRSGTIQWISKECSTERNEYHKGYNKEHSEERKEYHKNYAEEHSEELKEYSKEYGKNYYKEHAEELAGYYQIHREERLQYMRVYNKEHVEKHKVYVKKHSKEHDVSQKKYNKTPKGKEVKKRAFNKRKRKLGFEPLNEPFEGCEAHHVDKKRIIYIPKKLHRSIYHNVWTGEGMEEINKLAFEFLEVENAKN